MVTRTYMIVALWLGSLLQIQSAAVSASESAIALCPDRIIDGVSDQPLIGQAVVIDGENIVAVVPEACLLYTSPSPRDGLLSRMPSSA